MTPSSKIGLQEQGSSVLGIEDYLEPFGAKYSHANLKMLLKTFRKAPDRVVSFVGAGISKPLGSKDWPSLMEDLLKCASKDTLSKCEKLKSKTDAKGFDSKDFPIVAEWILRDIGTERDFQEVIRLYYAEHRLQTTSPMLEYLVLAIKNHLTTNFELCLENTYAHLCEVASYLHGQFTPTPYVGYFQGGFVPPANHKDHRIYYLHADHTQRRYILAESAYEQVYESNREVFTTTACIEHFYRNNSIIFAGFSFEDIFVKSCFKRLSMLPSPASKFYAIAEQESANPTGYHHFLLLSANRVPRPEVVPGTERFALRQYFDEWKQLGIYPILYKSGQHVFLQHLFRLLCYERYVGDSHAE